MRPIPRLEKYEPQKRDWAKDVNTETPSRLMLISDIIWVFWLVGLDFLIVRNVHEFFYVNCRGPCLHQYASGIIAFFLIPIHTQGCKNPLIFLTPDAPTEIK